MASGWLLDSFNKKGVKVIILKGVALAKTVYCDIGLRPVGDIDLLIKKEDFTHVEKIMSELGYLFQSNKSPEWYIENHYHIEYTNQEKNIPVEIHWHIASKLNPLRICKLDTNIIESWWEGAKAIKFSDRNALMLCPEDLILYMCLHFLVVVQFSCYLFTKGNLLGNFTNRS